MGSVLVVGPDLKEDPVRSSRTCHHISIASEASPYSKGSAGVNVGTVTEKGIAAQAANYRGEAVR